MTTAVANTNFTLVEYIWIDAYLGVRSKTKVVHAKSVKLSDLPEWNYDGSSTGQAPGTDSEVIMKPQALYRDPFRGENHVMVLCDTYTPQGVAIPTNTRKPAKDIFDKAPKEIPWFGIEQEYTLFKEGTPLGWPKSKARTFGGPTTQIGFPGPQGPYYCAAGADVAFGREIVDEHLILCLRAGLTISGTNGEVMPGQWEYQVGPCVGIASGDEMWMSRYLLHRVCEKYDVVASFEPKPIKGDWNGAGCHTNFSTKAMRENENSYETVIKPMMEKLAARHKKHIRMYGTGNHERLTGKHETSSMEKFSYGVANRGASVRIPNATFLAKKGYFEDRRPASNMDPYVVTSMVFETCCILPLEISTGGYESESEGSESFAPVSPSSALVKKSGRKTPRSSGGFLGFLFGSSKKA